MRRWRSFKSCSLCIHGKACHTILRLLRVLTNRVPLPPLFRGQNKTPRNTLFINGSTVSTGYCATSQRGKGGSASHQGGERISSPAGRLYGFIQTGALYNLEAPYNNPRARGASNLSPLRTFGPAGRQPSSPQGLSIWRPLQPSAAKPLSNLRTLEAIAPSDFRTLKPQRGLSPIVKFMKFDSEVTVKLIVKLM